MRQIWRRPYRYRLDRLPWRALFRLPSRTRVWQLADGAYRLACRVRYLADQWRPTPELERVEAAEAWVCSAPSVIAGYARSTDTELYRAERYLVDRYLQPGARLLDIGCGAGREARGFARRGLRVTAVDLSEALLVEARRQARSLPAGCEVTFDAMPLSRLAFPPATFDAVYFSSDVYACIPGRDTRVATLKRCRSMLRPGGVIVFPIYVRTGFSRVDRLLVDGPRRLLRPFFPHCAAEEGDRWVRTGPEEPAPLQFKHCFFTEEEVRHEIAAAGLTVTERVGDFYFTQAAR